MDDLLTEIGKRIRKIRGELGLIKFGEIIGVSKTMVSHYEDGNIAPRVDTMLKIAEYGGVSLEWLFTGKEPSTPIVHEGGETYVPNGKTEEEIINAHKEQIIDCLEKQGVDEVIAEKMLEATIREARITGTGPDGYINLGDFLKDAKRRLEKKPPTRGRRRKEIQKNGQCFMTTATIILSSTIGGKLDITKDALTSTSMHLTDFHSF